MGLPNLIHHLTNDNCYGICLRSSVQTSDLLAPLYLRVRFSISDLVSLTAATSTANSNMTLDKCQGFVCWSTSASIPLAITITITITVTVTITITITITSIITSITTIIITITITIIIVLLYYYYYYYYVSLSLAVSCSPAGCPTLLSASAFNWSTACTLCRGAAVPLRRCAAVPLYRFRSPSHVIERTTCKVMQYVILKRRNLHPGLTIHPHPTNFLAQKVKQPQL